MLATLTTAWGADVVRGIKMGYAGPVSSVEWQQGATSRWLIRSDQRIMGNLTWNFWTDESSLESQPFGTSVIPATHPQALPINRAPSWAIHPPQRFTDGFAPSHGLDASTHVAGLPFRCLRRVTFNAGGDGYFAYEKYGQLEWVPSRGMFINLPVNVVWPGLAGDLIVWTTLAALVAFGIPELRRWRRRRAGRCVMCGYSMEGLADDAVCPECGRKQRPSG